MTNIIIMLLAIYGLAFAIKETDGPWNIIGRWRNWMMRLPFIGVQFFKLLDCPFCLGWWCGIIIYFLMQESYKLNLAVCWGLTGAASNLIINAILNRLYRE